MNTEELKIWLDKPEGDHHDFKEHWYHKGQKPELVKDIFSFVNTVHHDDCLLILGVNDQRKVTGVEDDENWRLNQQQLIDFMRKLPISGNRMLTLLEIQPLTIIKLKGYSKNILEWIHQLKNGISIL